MKILIIKKKESFAGAFGAFETSEKLTGPNSIRLLIKFSYESKPNEFRSMEPLRACAEKK